MDLVPEASRDRLPIPRSLRDEYSSSLLGAAGRDLRGTLGQRSVSIGTDVEGVDILPLSRGHGGYQYGQ